MAKNRIGIFVIGLIILIAVLTNPNLERQKEAVKNKLTEKLQQSVKSGLSGTDQEWQQAGQTLGMMLGGAVVDRMVDNLITSDNYVIFSTTKISWDGQTKVIGIAAFGNVFLTRNLNEITKEGLVNNP